MVRCENNRSKCERHLQLEDMPIRDSEAALP